MVITEAVEVRQIEASGDSWAVEMRCGADAGIPDDAALEVSEVTGAVAEVFTEQAARVLDVDVDSFTYVKVLDMALRTSDGEKAEPLVPVDVRVRLLDVPEALDMAELLIVVAIIGVLAGVSFVAVQNHQRSLAQLERNTIAKEIYFAAQNHLTMAESQGLLSEEVEASFYGNPETSDDRKNTSLKDETAKGIYYVVADGGAWPPILDLMLPFGAIDETVRAGGFYIIRYQANPAIVLDVFYCSRQGEPEKYNYNGGDSYNTFLGYRNRLPGSGYVVGWYGGATPGEAGTYLETPSLTVSNAEKLTVTVTNPNNDNGSLQLIETGVSSGAQAVFVLDEDKDDEILLPNHRVSSEGGQYNIVLDDISKPDDPYGWHFADLYDADDPLGLTVDKTFIQRSASARLPATRAA